MKMKITPIYSLKERVIKDVKKEHPAAWIAIGILWLVIISLFIGPSDAKAVEDYSTSLPDYPYEFGEQLKKDSVNLVGAYTTEQRNAVILAWKISHDKEFLYMLAAENGHFSPDRKGDAGASTGYCQIHSGYHPKVTSHPKFLNPVWQMHKCYELWEGGTKFYGHDRVKYNPGFRKKIEAIFKFY